MLQIARLGKSELQFSAVKYFCSLASILLAECKVIIKMHIHRSRLNNVRVRCYRETPLG